MKKQLLSKHLIKLVFVLLLLCSSYYSFTNGSAGPTGNTNAPGDGNCTGCHSGSGLITSGTNWGNFTITTNVPTNGYSPGTTYTVTVSHTVTGINKWGFQALILNGSNAQAGSLTAGTDNQIVTSGTKSYATHTSSGNTGTGTRSWSFNWVAPNPSVGNVTIYATVNAANGDGGLGGDQIYAKTLTVIELTNLPTADITGIPLSNSVCVGDTLNLVGNGINSPTGFAWTFTGLAASSSQTPNVVFTSSGTKTITLITTNTFGNSTQTIRTISVLPKPSAVLVPSGSTLNKCGNDSVTISTTANSAFSFLWSPGNQITQAIRVADSGSYFLVVTNPTTGCFTKTAPIRVNTLTKPIPVLTASSDTLCERDSLTLTSSSPFNSYRFFNQSALLQSGALSSYKNKFAPGSRSLNLVVTGANGCVSDTVRKIIHIQPASSAPVLNCGDKTTSSITFTWLSIAGALSYEVSLDTGKTWTQPNGIVSHTVSDLLPNSNVQLWARGIFNDYCAQGNIGTLVCTNGACNPIEYVLTFDKKVCLQSATDSSIVPVMIDFYGNVSSYYVSFGNGNYTNNLRYNSKAFIGNNSLSIKVLDSLNIGCPRVDTVINFEGINPISKTPLMGIIGALCSSDSSLQTFAVFNANSGASYFNVFRNSDTIPFTIINSNESDTVSTSILRGAYPINSGDVLHAVAIDTTTGCFNTSMPYTAAIYNSPKPGFTSTTNFLEVTFTDTTSASAKRDWFFFGALPNDLNGAKTITKSFTSNGAKTIRMLMTDSNGCSENAQAVVTLFNTGLISVSVNEIFSIYPNPVKDKLLIELKNNQHAEIKIFDMKGDLVLEETFTNEQLNADVSYLSKGLYIVHISTGENQRFSSRFMKE